MEKLSPWCHEVAQNLFWMSDTDYNLLGMKNSNFYT